MPITFNCACGKTLRVKDELAGKRVKCPACDAVAAVPAAEPQFEVVEEPPPKPVSRPLARPAAKPAAVDDEDDEPRPKAKAKRDDEGYDLEDEDDKPAKKSAAKWKRDEDDEDRPKKKRRRDEDDDEDDDRPRKKKRRRAAEESGSGNSGNRMGYVIGGLLCVLIGAAIAYFSYNSDARRSTGRMIGGIVMSVAGGISAIRGFTGNVPDDDEEDE
jgi:hypothetical protein